MKILACDIGATKTETAVYGIENKIPVLINSQKFLNVEFRSPEDIILKYLKNISFKIDCACIGVPGPVEEGRCTGTNIKWEFSEFSLSEKFRIKKLKLVNDIEAIAAAIPFYKEENLITVYKGSQSDKKRNKAIIAPGTGLGQAAMIYNEGKYITVSTEGGHTDFSPDDETEAELMFYLKKKFGHASYERVASGSGIRNIFNFLKDIKKYEVSNILEKNLASDDPAKVIYEQSLIGKSRICEKTFDIFISALGRQTGNIVLNFKATGGVYLAGGIPLKIQAMIRTEKFVNSYLRKGELSYLNAAAPVYIISDPSAAIFGAAVTASLL
jgi:glucokinase